MVNPEHPVSVTRQCQLLSLNRAMFYYQPKSVSTEDLHIFTNYERLFLSSVNT